MVNFPLYDSLFSEVKSNRDLNKSQKNNFIKDLETIDTQGLELIYTLIKVYEIKNEKSSITNYNLPYGGFYRDSVVVFDLEKMPKKLKRMLFNFIKLHKKAMKEEVERP